MKLLRRVLLGLLLLVIIAGVIVYLNLNRIVKKTVQTKATESLNLTTTLGSARLSLFGGKLHLGDLEVASPQGFSAPKMLTLGDTDVAVSYGQLRQDPVHVQSLVLKDPKLVIEQSGGTMNFKKAMELMPPSDSSQESMKLVIDDLQIQNAQVVVHPGIPGLAQEITVPVPTITMKDVGSGEGSHNGAALKDVAMQIITTLAGHASESGALPDQLKALLKVNVGQVVANLGAEAQKRIAGALPGQFGKTLSEALKDPQSLMKDPAKALQQNFGGLLGGKSDNSPATQPGQVQQAEDALQNLLGNKKRK